MAGTDVVGVGGEIFPTSATEPTPEIVLAPPLQTSVMIDRIAGALAAAQGKMQSPPRNREVKVKTKTGGTYSFKYSTLDKVISTVREALSENEICYTQPLCADSSGKYKLVTLLAHSSGQWMASETPLMVEEKSSQAFGSALTYMRRYALCAMLGVAADEDDDGNAADGNSAEPVPARRATARRGTAKPAANDNKNAAPPHPPKLIPVEHDGGASDWPGWKARFAKGIAYAPDLTWLEQFLKLNDAPRGNFARGDPDGNKLIAKVIDNRRSMLAQAPVDTPKAGIDL